MEVKLIYIYNIYIYNIYAASGRYKEKETYIHT